jgi:hypothetical protein
MYLERRENPVYNQNFNYSICTKGLDATQEKNTF